MKDKSFSRDTDDEQIILRGGRKILVSKYLITTLDKLFVSFTFVEEQKLIKTVIPVNKKVSLK